MRRHLAYLRYVLRHKFYVFVEGRRLGVPIWMLLFHDWDKFLPEEWFPYARTFYEANGSKKKYAETPEFAHAWMKHQHRNKHHWQWWVQVDGLPLRNTRTLIWDRGTLGRLFYNDWTESMYMSEELLEWNRVDTDPMPDVYRREMLADWRGAGRAQGYNDTLGWYIKNCDKMILHPETRAWIEEQLGVEGA